LRQFDNNRVEEDQGKTGKIIIFRVTEKKLIRSVKYEGVKSITNSEILEKLRDKKASISQESPYDPTKIRKAETIIKMMLAEKGHQDATVEATTEDIPPTSIAVTFKVDEGPKIRIQKISIEGNKVYSDGQIKKERKLNK